jgi:hypothetical protein
VWVGHSCPTLLTLLLAVALAVGAEVVRVGRALLSDAFDLGVDLAIGLEVAGIGQTLLPDASDPVLGSN